MYFRKKVKMKNIIKSIIFQFLFLMALFAIQRIVFILFYANLLNDIEFTSILALFWHAIKLDVSTACYLLGFPFFVLFIQSLFQYNFFNWVIKIYYFIFIPIYSLVTASEIGLYDEWQTKLTYKALRYLTNPSEIFNSVDTFRFIYLLLTAFLLGFTSIWFYKKYFFVKIEKFKRNFIFSFFFLIVCPPLIFSGIRGGWQQIPINQSESYFSKHDILNIAAVNAGWNIFKSVLENNENLEKNPFQFYNTDEAEKTVKQLHEVPKDTTISILTTQRPNVVVILLESWSADLIESLGGEPGITPRFKALEKDGLLFTNFVGNGARSEQGMANIFSSFPAHPYSSITIQPSKYPNLKSMPKKLKENGYNTSFYFGGQLIYGNIKSYIIFNQFDKIWEIYDFDKSIPQGKLGIHDQYTMDIHLKELDKHQQPFFSSLFTVSTHSPFDMPMKKVINWGGDVCEYLNSAYYTDSCLGAYIDVAKTKDWYKNTLFIILADHSHHSYKQWGRYTFEYYKIPMIFYGDVLKPEYRGKKYNKIASQVDIASTLLNQLGISAKEFEFSKNLFNPYSKEFAYYAFEEGLGWVVPENTYSYDKTLNRYHVMNIPDSVHKEQIIKDGNSYLQTVFQRFLDY